ncbi:MAG: AAA family ATPase [Anaerolineaceae bacterium]|jgi:type II secretory pathway predicted ATPase ExeA|nr:AAA family ATPase [Anaerolineaceae bacterium]MDY0280591.1 AAA family ATPase [Salinivirgaceae bacterium]
MADQRMRTLQKIGFNEEPFSRSADPRFFWKSELLADSQMHLRQMISQRRALGIVEANYGMGKSALARMLHSAYLADPNNYVTLYTHSTVYSSLFSVLKDVGRRLGVRQGSFGSTTTALREIEKVLIRHYQDGKNVVLFFDDAQGIKPEGLHAFRIFYNFDVTEKLVQCLLFTQPEIRKNLDKVPEVVSRIDTWLQLSPLSVSETSQMVNHRTTLAGRDAPLFTKYAFELLWEKSFGVPREIMSVCNTALNILIEQDDKTIIDEAMFEKACGFLDKNRSGVNCQQQDNASGN